eukprot:287229-Chlamydomonas_euryale.AAC.5
MRWTTYAGACKYRLEHPSRQSRRQIGLPLRDVLFSRIEGTMFSLGAKPPPERGAEQESLGAGAGAAREASTLRRSSRLQNAQLDRNCCGVSPTNGALCNAETGATAETIKVNFRERA